MAFYHSKHANWGEGKYESFQGLLDTGSEVTLIPEDSNTSVGRESETGL